jgi:lipopolysaccharide export LptBFGC system permease protein LptF
MRLLKPLLTISIILGLIFITIGDQFLPKPLSTYSRNTRASINQKLLSLMPNPKIKRPSAEREKQVEQLQENTSGKPSP